jgi:DNA-binding IclR family transcriptional regulator
MAAAYLPKILSALSTYERDGYVISKASLHPQINAVGVPVRSEDGTRLLALSSGGIQQLFDDDRLHEVGRELLGLASQLASVLSAQQEDKP